MEHSMCVCVCYGIKFFENQFSEIGALCKRIVDPFSTGLNIDIHLVFCCIYQTQKVNIFIILYTQPTHTFKHKRHTIYLHANSITLNNVFIVTLLRIDR